MGAVDAVRGLADEAASVAGLVVEDVAVLCPRFAVIHEGHLVAETTPSEARKTLEGKIFEGTGTNEELDALRAQHRVTQAILVEGENRVRVELAHVKGLIAALADAAADLAGAQVGDYTPAGGELLTTEQVDALRMNKVDPISYLIVPRFLACLVMVPAIVIFATVISLTTGTAMAYYHFGVNPQVFIMAEQADWGSYGADLLPGVDAVFTKPFEFAELAARITTGERILSLETRHLAIFALAKLAESRDPETGQHLERIREYTKALAISLTSCGQFQNTLTPTYVSTLYHTSPLHDIGKVGIPDSILLKPGRLSDEEFQAMKHHTTIGGETLGSVSRQYRHVDYLRIGAEIAMSHHERFNGKGYPMHLKGDSIPLSARIVALTDVYDAVTSKRVYKTAYTHDVARDIIAKERGEHFDPRVVDAFTACESEFVRIAEEFNDAARTHSASFSTGGQTSEEAPEEAKVA